jgi:hypothetical protein
LVCVVVSKTTEKNPVPVMSEEIKQKLIAKFAAGTSVGSNNLTIVSLSIIVSDDLSGGYKEGDEW